MDCLVDCGDGGPGGVVVGNLDLCAFDELVGDVPRGVGEIPDSGELNTEVCSDVNADITGCVVGGVHGGMF